MFLLPGRHASCTASLNTGFAIEAQMDTFANSTYYALRPSSTAEERREGTMKQRVGEPVAVVSFTCDKLAQQKAYQRV
jgi:hypothetical protein